MSTQPTEEESDEKQWRDALGNSPARDFTPQIFSCKPAMVKRDPVNGHRMWTQYDSSKFSEKEYEIVPGMWDHEHCSICWMKISEGDPFWQNSAKHILCPSCHAKFEKRANKSPDRTPPGGVGQL